MNYHCTNESDLLSIVTEHTPLWAFCWLPSIHFSILFSHALIFFSNLSSRPRARKSRTRHCANPTEWKHLEFFLNIIVRAFGNIRYFKFMCKCDNTLLSILISKSAPVWPNFKNLSVLRSCWENLKVRWSNHKYHPLHSHKVGKEGRKSLFSIVETGSVD